MTDVATEPQRQQPELNRVLSSRLLLLFVIGDVLGTGVYALTGEVAGEVGGAAWVPFLVAFVVATITAFSYLELVTKYPQAAGAALYTHRAFGIHFLTFIVAFMVMCSGITSASTASKAFASNLAAGLGTEWEGASITIGALAFMTLVALVNLRGVGESVRANVVLTLVELSGLLLVILVGVWAMTQGEVDFGRVTMFDTQGDKNAFLAVTAATTLAFFAMVGFEDSVNMAEETKDPVRTFPRVLLTGLTTAGVIYVLVSISAVAVVPVGELEKAGDTALLAVVEAGAPDFPVDDVFPFIAMFAVANTALINMLMASRLLYGMGKEDVLPRSLARVHETRRTPYVSIIFTTLIAFGLIIAVTTFVDDEATTTLGGTTALLLLAVFTVVNVAVLVLRRDPVDGDHFRAPTALPVVGVLTCAFLVGPWTGRDGVQYQVAGWLLALGVVLWLGTWLWNRSVRAKRTGFRHPEELSG
jgi:amino acid transporter